MPAKQSMAHVYLASMLLLATIPVASIGYLWVSQQYESFETRVADRRNNHVKNREQLLRNGVERIIDYINYEKSQVETRLRESIRFRTLEAFSLIESLDNELLVSNRLSETEARGLMVSALRPLSFKRGGGQALLIDGEGRWLMRGASGAESDLSTVINKKPAVVSSVLKMALSQGEGFVDLPPANGESEGKAPGVLYVKFYQRLNLIVISGGFIAQVEQQVREGVLQRLSGLNDQVGSPVSFIRRLSDGQLLTSNAITHPAAAEISPELLASYRQTALLPVGGFVQHASFVESGASAGSSYVKGFPEWGWLIGSSFYADDLVVQIAAERELLQREIMTDVVNVVILVLVIILAAVAVARWFAYQNKLGFTTFAHFFNAASTGSNHIDERQLPYSEFALLAASANQMIDERSHYEQALRMSEQRFELALKHSRHFMWDVRRDNGALEVSGNFFSQLGYSSNDFDPHDINSVFAITHPKDRELLESAFSLPRDDGNFEFRLRNSAGRYRWFYCRGGAIEFDHFGRVIRALGIITDISERKRIERELMSAKISAEDANHAKSQFLSSMSHELRTPLNGVLGYAQLMLKDETLTTEHKQCLTSIVDSGQHLLMLIGDILDLSKIESGNLEVNLAPCSLEELLQAISDTMYQKAKAKGLIYKATIDSRLPSAIYTDETKLKQILLNLMSNAIKFTQEGEIELRVELDDKSDKLLFWVKDSGIGIAGENILSIFQPFQQVGGRDAYGTGLGLAICNRLAEALSGGISVTSRIGKGSCFTLELPMRICSSLQEEGVSSVNKFEGDQQEVLSVLVVDNGADRRELVAMLERAGMRCCEAENGEQARTLMRDQLVSAVLIDMQDAAVDGVALVKAIRNDASLTQLVIIGVAEGGVEKNSLAGCTDIIARPVSAGALLEKLSLYLKGVVTDTLKSTDQLMTVPELPASSAMITEDQIRLMNKALRLGDIEGLRELLSAQFESSESLELKEWLEYCLSLLDSFDLDALEQLLNQLCGPEAVA